jgi:hypothetical protein
MAVRRQQFKKKLKALASPPIQEEFAFLGNLITHEVEADPNGNVYITYSNLQVDTVYNQTVPLILGRPVAIWFHEGVRQIRRFVSPWTQKPPANIANHAKSHGWAAWDPVEVTPEQFLALLVRPEVGTMNVHIFGGEFYVNGADHVKENETLDLAASVPATGAQWGIIEIDEDGVSYVTLGSVVAGRELLEREDIPQPTALRKRLCAIKFYAGQTQVIKTPTDTDIIDLRFNGFASGGGVPLLDPDSVVITDAAGNLDTDANFMWDVVRQALTKGSTPAPVLGDHVLHWQGAEDGSVSALHFLWSWGAAASRLNGYGIGGTKGSPTATVADQVLLILSGRGAYDDSGLNYSPTQVQIRLVADDDWTNVSRPTRIEFWTTPVGSTTMALVMTINADGTITGAVAITEAEIDFGSTVAFSKTFTVVDAAILPSHKIMVVESAETPTGKEADEHEFDGLIFKAVAGTGQFTLYVKSLYGAVYGKFKINYIFQ